MNDIRAFPILFVTTLLAVVAAVITLGDSDAATVTLEGTGQPLVPELAASINDVARVELVAADQSLELERDGDVWRLATWQDFPAKADSVKHLVVALADAVRLQARTALPARHHLLDVEQPAEPDSEALRVRLADEAGATLADVVLGSSVRGPPRSERLNARRLDSAQTWMVDGAWRPPTSPAQWVEQQLLARPAEDMAEVELTLPDGDAIRLERAPQPAPGADDDAGDAGAPPAEPDPASAPWRVANVPAGREARTDADLDALADALASLRMQAVALEPAPENPDETWSARFTTHDGLVITARITRAGDTHRLRLDLATREGSGGARSEEAQTLAREVGAWEYLVSPSVAERFRGAWDALLEPLPEPEPDVAPPAPTDDPDAPAPLPVIDPPADDEPAPAPPVDGDG